MNKALDPKSLLAKVRDLEAKKTVYYCPFLEGEITVNRLPFETILDHYENTCGASNVVEGVETFIMLVYDACPIFKSAELKQGLDNIVEPSDTVKAVYGYNIDALTELALFIYGQYGLKISEGEENNPEEDEIVQELKN